MGEIREAPCPACEGPTEYMGRVERGRVVEDEEDCPCDARCTAARGPNCDCSCGGENHGSDRLVKIIRDKGKAPRLSPIDDEKARARAEEYRAALEAANDRFRTEFASEIAAKEKGEFVGSARFYEMRSQRYVLLKAGHMKAHRSRLAALTSFLSPGA